jgi:hypothetical protein
MVDWERVEQDDLKQTAYHEAGHALWTLGRAMGLDRVWLEPSGTADPTRENIWVGHTAGAPWDQPEFFIMPAIVGRAYLLAQLLLAGDAAVTVLSGHAEEDEEEAGELVVFGLQGTDHEGLQKQLAILAPDDDGAPELLASALAASVLRFLLANRETLDAIAQALAQSEKHSLTEREVLAFVAVRWPSPRDDATHGPVGPGGSR